MALNIEQRGGAVRVAVRAQPRASRNEIVGEHGGAPPVEGAANEELVRFLARTLSVPASAVRIVAGERGRNKIVEVDGLDAESVRRALGV